MVFVSNFYNLFLEKSIWKMIRDFQRIRILLMWQWTGFTECHSPPLWEVYIKCHFFKFCCHLFFPLTFKIGENGCMPFIFNNKYCKSAMKLAICYLVHTQFVCRNYVGHIFISIFIRSPANAHNSHKCVWFRVRWIWLSIKIELSFIAGDDIVYMR